VNAWNQARILQRSGGRSMRLARSGGSMRKWGEETRRPSLTFVGWTSIVKAARALTGLSVAAFGSAESPHGAELTHGLASAWLDSERGIETRDWIFTSRGPQQHESPLHLVLHVQ
jgi:hypothetical protein